jgi:phage shock protein PspC (stress-responsive transcriptional regulator)
MQKVIVVNLNGNAYQLDEPAYQALRAYLDTAAERLTGNPDQSEILADIEQAIADKCGRYVGPHKTVVVASEVEQIIAEMGPVDVEAPERGSNGAAGGARQPGKASAAPASGPTKRLYQIEDGAVISGLCNGIAAYFDVDATIVRIIFVALAFLTGGLWILVYIVLMFVVPYAETQEEHAAARGMPFNTRALIEQAKKKYAELTEGHRWKGDWKRDWRRHRRAWRQQRREWRRQWRQSMGMPPGLAHGARAAGRLSDPARSRTYGAAVVHPQRRALHRVRDRHDLVAHNRDDLALDAAGPHAAVGGRADPAHGLPGACLAPARCASRGAVRHGLWVLASFGRGWLHRPRVWNRVHLARVSLHS